MQSWQRQSLAFKRCVHRRAPSGARPNAPLDHQDWILMGRKLITACQQDWHTRVGQT